MRFDTKIAIVVRADLPTWQRLNMTAFLASAVAGGRDGVLGQPYEDGSGRAYLPMFRQPVLIFGASGEDLRRTWERAVGRPVGVAVFTDELFSTGNDEDNRAAVRAVPGEKLALAGLALHGRRPDIDKIVKGLSLHP
ncbi:DUF2000 domain-containing protein [Rhizomonospora bruguierae]|uniref:DUF2000 domain-containing protein n=1 Tax=Rhizomonospora bruguierae TaxID=1581705 RepID=UPI001BD03844|nr:DUF2000 domain-containing protein [Micromonospora sp. NBRC 107566]